MPVKSVVCVDPDSSGLERIGDLHGRLQVGGVDSGSETVGGRVANLDDFFLGLELGDGAHWSKNLFLLNLHVLGDVGEDGRLNEVALLTLALTARLDGGASLLALLDVAELGISDALHTQMSEILPHDTIELKLRNLRTLEGLLGEWVTDVVLSSTLPESLHELVIDGLLYVDTRTSAAGLTMVEVDTKVDPVEGLVQISVGEDNVGALASELESDLLQVGAGGSLHDLTTDNGGTSEGNLVDIHVGRDGSTRNLTETGDDVDDTWWETGFLDEAGSNICGQRSLLGSLDDNGVTSGNGRANLPSPHEKREVPWDDLTAHTNLTSFSYVVRKPGRSTLTGSLRM